MPGLSIGESGTGKDILSISSNILGISFLRFIKNMWQTVSMNIAFDTEISDSENVSN